MTPTPAGQFDKRVTLLRRNTGNVNPLGEAVGLDVPAQIRWAKITPRVAREFQTAAQELGEITHTVTLRYTPDISTHDALLYRGRRLEIAGLYDPEERHVELVALCKEIT